MPSVWAFVDNREVCASWGRSLHGSRGRGRGAISDRNAGCSAFGRKHANYASIIAKLYCNYSELLDVRAAPTYGGCSEGSSWSRAGDRTLMDHEGKATEAVTPGVGTPSGSPSRSSVSSQDSSQDDASDASRPVVARGTSTSSTDTSNMGGANTSGSSPATTSIGGDSVRSASDDEPKRKVKARPRPPAANSLRKFREELCLSQAELARRANLSALTVARIEQGYGCRMSTKRKILEALGLSLADRKRVFGEEE